MISRDLEPLVTTDAFQAFCQELDASYLFQEKTLFLRTPCLLIIVYGYIVEDIVYFDVYDLASNRQSNTSRLIDSLPETGAAVEIYEHHKAQRRPPVLEFHNPDSVEDVMQVETHFFSELEIIRRLMPDLVACDLTRYMECFDAAFPIFPTHYATALGRFQSAWGRSSVSERPAVPVPDQPYDTELALLRFVLAQHELIETVRLVRDLSGRHVEGTEREAIERWLPSALPQLEHDCEQLRHAASDALAGDFRGAHALAATYQDPASWEDGLAVDEAPEDARQELHWAIDAVFRTSAEFVQTAGRTSLEPAAAATAARPSGVPGARQDGALQRALYRVALAHQQLLRAVLAEVEGVHGAPSLLELLRADTGRLRAAIRAAHIGDLAAAAEVAGMGAQRARQALGVAQPGAVQQLARQVLGFVQPRASTGTPGSQRRIAAAAAELALWAERAQAASKDAVRV